MGAPNSGHGGGPDWEDVATMVRELEKLHQVTVKVEIACDGRNYAGTLNVRVMAGAPVLIGPGQCWRHEILRGWPTHRKSTMQALVYGMLHELDARCSADLWRQVELPLAGV